MRTVILCDGKYEFDLDEKYGFMVSARRNGVEWPAGSDLLGSKVFTAALWRIVELEDEVASR